ncbi:MAG TPA: glycoside hydrolase family 3 protein [Kribbellaceae bacterium]|nr:glycoside hydrolase family 3 protein [Kribbellaceae bacterium]
MLRVRPNPTGPASPRKRMMSLAVPLVLAGTLAASALTAAATPVTQSAGSSYRTDAQGRTLIKNDGQPYLNAALPVAQRVDDLLSRMTLEEKVGQMTQAERGAVDADPSLVTTWALGALLSGGGSVPTPNTPTAWADMVDRFQSAALATRLQIPLLYGVDSVHGHGNLYGATVFPHNIGLGATRDAGLITRVEQVTAAETRATGPQWAFAPCVCVARDARWGRTYESFSEDPQLAARLGSAAIDGLQGTDVSANDRVLATAKHYAGDGDTEYGTSTTWTYKLDQGVTVTSRQDFARIDLAPYLPAVQRHDVATVMPSYSSVDWTEDGIGNPIKMHANRELITDVLKGDLAFGGFVISDWEGLHQLPGDWANQVRTAVNAGTDMFMEPFTYQDFETTLLDEVHAGRVPMARIDDAVRRILAKKFELGLFEHPYTDRTHLSEVGSAAHRAVARQAVAESQVLLKNAGGVLPLSKHAKVYVAGRNADNMGNQTGGWTLSWQGASGQHRSPGNTILDGIRQTGADVTFSADGSAPVGDADVAVVAVGETPYAEGPGDVGGPQWAYDPEDGGVPREPKSMDLQPVDRDVIDRVCGAVAKCVVLVVSGRPQVIAPAQLAKIDALVASWLPGSQGEGVADVLFGVKPFTGKLAHSWPRSADQEPINVGDRNYDPLYPYGWGLRTGR